MKALIRAMPAFFRASVQIMIQYRGEMVLWAIWGVVYPAVAMAMWSAAVAGTAGGAHIGGFAPRDFAAYFLTTMIVGHLASAWDVFEMGYLVRTGRMSAKLMRPILPMWESLSDNLAYKVVTLSILMPIWVLVALVSKPVFHSDSVHLAGGLLATVFGAALNYLWGYNLALLAFWVTRMDAVGQLWFGLGLFFGGRIAPLTIMPEPIQWVAAVLPFQWKTYFPAAVLIGRIPVDRMLMGLGIQILWLILAVITFRLLWRQALRQHTAVGA